MKNLFICLAQFKYTDRYTSSALCDIEVQQQPHKKDHSLHDILDNYRQIKDQIKFHVVLFLLKNDNFLFFFAKYKHTSDTSRNNVLVHTHTNSSYFECIFAIKNTPLLKRKQTFLNLGTIWVRRKHFNLVVVVNVRHEGWSSWISLMEAAIADVWAWMGRVG